MRNPIDPSLHRSDSLPPDPVHASLKPPLPCVYWQAAVNNQACDQDLTASSETTPLERFSHSTITFSHERTGSSGDEVRTIKGLRFSIELTAVVSAGHTLSGHYLEWTFPLST